MKSVRNNKNTELSFEIDNLTNSIRNVYTGESFMTEVSYLTKTDLKQITKKNKWLFNWKAEFEDNSKEVYKLTIVDNSTVIHGLLCLSVEIDHIYMNLLESAHFNIGRNKIFEGVAGNLVAFACKKSFQFGFEGYVSFSAKTKLIEHYKKTLHAQHYGGQLMIIDTVAANYLVNKYF